MNLLEIFYDKTDLSKLNPNLQPGEAPNLIKPYLDICCNEASRVASFKEAHETNERQFFIFSDTEAVDAKVLQAYLFGNKQWLVAEEHYECVTYTSKTDGLIKYQGKIYVLRALTSDKILIHWTNEKKDKGKRVDRITLHLVFYDPS